MQTMSSFLKLFTTATAAWLIFSAGNAAALNFYGAEISDEDVPSVYFKVGIFGSRPVVTSVATESVAEKLGLRRGNIILAVNGSDITTTGDLLQIGGNALSVLVINGFEAKALYFEKHVLEKPNSSTAPRKAAGKGRIAQHSETPTEDRPVPTRTPEQTAGKAAIPANTQLLLPVAASPPDGTSSILLRKQVQEKIPQKALTADIQQPLTSLELVTRFYKPGDTPAAKPKPAQDKSGQATRDAGQPGKGVTPVAPPLPPSEAAPVTIQAPTLASDIFTTPIKPAYDRILFKNDRGDVQFTHSTHLKSLNREQCLLCHWTPGPTLNAIQTRLANHRTAHSLCRGCHQKMENGPVAECHHCHNR